jgi:hypothetical protein
MQIAILLHVPGHRLQRVLSIAKMFVMLMSVHSRTVASEMDQIAQVGGIKSGSHNPCRQPNLKSQVFLPCLGPPNII